jgi:hypothetical protein
MQRSNREDFIHKLQSEVLFQSRLEQKKLLPEKLDGLGRVVASYPWQTILIISGVTALVRVLTVL